MLGTREKVEQRVTADSLCSPSARFPTQQAIHAKPGTRAALKIFQTRHGSEGMILTTLTVKWRFWVRTAVLVRAQKRNGSSCHYRGWNGGVGTTAALAFSPNSRMLASAHIEDRDTNQIRLWDVATGNRVATLSEHTDWARTVAFHPSGELLASAGSDRTIRLWNLEEGSCRVLKGHTGTIHQVAFSRDGKTLFSASNDHTVRLWDVATGDEKPGFPGAEPFTSLVLSADGHTLAASDEAGFITLWDLETRERRGLLHDDGRVLRALAFSPDGRTLASAGETGPIRLWDPLTGQELLALSGHSGTVHSLAFAPDGSSLASCSHDGSVRLWRGR